MPLPTKRLRFSRWNDVDPAHAHALWGDEAVTRLIGGPWTHAQCSQRLADQLASDVQYWPLMHREDGEFVGCCGLRPRRAQAGSESSCTEFELGFHLMLTFWGRRLAAEAATSVILHAFGPLGATALYAGHNPANVASRKVLTRIGFTQTHEEYYEPTGLMHPTYLLHRPLAVPSMGTRLADRTACAATETSGHPSLGASTVGRTRPSKNARRSARAGGATAAILAAALAAALRYWLTSEGELPPAEMDPSLEYFSEWSECAEETTVQCGVAVDPAMSGVWRDAQFRLARRLVPPTTVRRLLAGVKEATYLTDADTIDGRPTWERYVIKRGRVLDRRLALLSEPATAPLTALVRRVMTCPDCQLCDVLIRRYLPSERRTVPRHYDSRAYATAVLTLNAAEFRGGYFVWRGRAVHLLAESGDVIVHGFNLKHGVSVTHGARYALIAWFKPRPGLCFSDGNPWLVDLVQQGDAEAARQLRSPRDVIYIDEQSSAVSDDTGT